MLEIVVIRKLETSAGRHEAANATGAVKTLAGTAIAEHQTVVAVVAGNVQHIIMVIVAIAAVPLVADAEHQIRKHTDFNKAVSPVALVLLRGEILQFRAESYLI